MSSEKICPVKKRGKPHYWALLDVAPPPPPPPNIIKYATMKPPLFMIED